MKCGGSDGLSGITANPLVGKIANRIAARGRHRAADRGAGDVRRRGGAARARATSANVAKNAIDMVNNFRAYFRKYNQPIDENPAPGNKAGGITTLAEKSLGCVQKGGRRAGGAGAGVRRAGAGRPGRHRRSINAPGNDGVSSTAMVAAGAHILLFTTGRGTPLGFPAPTIKISTNSDLAEKKPSWIDFDAGPIALGHQRRSRSSGRRAVFAGARRRQRAHADQERAQRLPRDRDLEGRRHALSVAGGGSIAEARRALLASGHELPPELAVRAAARAARAGAAVRGGQLSARVRRLDARAHEPARARSRAAWCWCSRSRPGMAKQINGQDGLYTLILRGLSDGRIVEQREVVSAVSRCIDPYQDFDAYIACADEPGAALRRLEHHRGGDQDRSGRRASTRGPRCRSPAS